MPPTQPKTHSPPRAGGDICDIVPRVTSNGREGRHRTDGLEYNVVTAVIAALSICPRLSPDKPPVAKVTATLIAICTIDMKLFFGKLATLLTMPLKKLPMLLKKFERS
jgi:hypothetical protein